MKISTIAAGIIIAAVIVLCGGGLCLIPLIKSKPSHSDSNKNAGQQPEPETRGYPDDGKQAERWELIETFVAEGVFVRVGYGGGTLPKAWVSDAFLLLGEDDQNRPLSVVYAFYNIEDDGFGIPENPLLRDRLEVRLDNGTAGGRRLGEYDPYDGLHFD